VEDGTDQDSCIQAYTIAGLDWWSGLDWTGLDSVWSKIAQIKTAVYIQTVNITYATQAVSLSPSKVAS